MKNATIIIIAAASLSFSAAMGQEADFRPENSIEISLTDLPSHVRDVLDSDEYERWKVIGVYRSNAYQKDGPNARYLIQFQQDKEYKDVYLDGAGIAYDPD